MEMDASLLLACDGLRAVAKVAANVVVANAAETGDRIAFAAAADVEHACSTALGVTAAENDDDDSPAPAARKGVFAMIPGLQQFPKLVGFKTGGSAAEVPAADAAELAAATALKRAIATAQLTPVTDIVVVHGGDALPPGYTKVAYSVTGMYPADLSAVRWRCFSARCATAEAAGDAPSSTLLIYERGLARGSSSSLCCECANYCFVV